ncbi:efflux transporter outer membrane subunit [Cupriavidus respiraculi]|uniref:efflux transporter outer membrane subunit n=1 Tax=Cupriavidus respiraculi TaxID=195930 RepID=UPI002D803B83|nr:efflux transporter outer membrane subunit [Cupriavidus respiraculi]
MKRKRMSTMLPWPVLAAAALVAGCSLAPVYERPASPVPTQWASGQASANEPHAGPVAPSAARVLQWQQFIVDDELRRLVATAIGNNRGLRQAMLDIEAARALYRVQRAERVPAIQAEAGGSRQRLAEDLRQAGVAPVQQAVQATAALPAFELDLFGRVRNLSDAALREYLATEEAARGVRVSLIAEVVQAYLARDGARRRHLLTMQTLRAREASLRLIAQRRQAGTATALDFFEASALTDQARADLERTDREVRQASNALGLLVGVPDAVPTLPDAPRDDLLLVQRLAAGTPSDLLADRPDIRAAEQRLRARHADIGAARAAFFPSITLTGMFGSASDELSGLFGAGQAVWSFAPQLTLPIFSGGRNVANLDLAQARRDMAVAEYEKTIQTAFREVSDALAAGDTLRREEIARRAAAQTSEQTLRLSEARYRAGVDDHLRYLEAQRSHYAAQTALIEVAVQRQSALAALFRALGGGWAADEPPMTGAMPAAPRPPA